MAVVGLDVDDVGGFFSKLKKLAKKAAHVGVQSLPGGSVIDAVAGGAVDSAIDKVGGGGGKKKAKKPYTFTGYKRVRGANNRMNWVATLKGPKGAERWQLKRLLHLYDQVSGAPSKAEIQAKIGDTAATHDRPLPPPPSQSAAAPQPFYKNPYVIGGTLLTAVGIAVASGSRKRR